MTKDIPLSDKFLLTLNEASAYFNIGVCRLRELSDEKPEFVLWCGGKRLLRRKVMEVYFENQYSI